MKTATQRLPTLLLGAFALWSVLVVVCVYAGLGGRYSLHPDDPSRVPALPQLDLSRAQTPLGDLTDYAQVGERPLFNSDRRPIPVATTPGAETGPTETPPLDVVLTSVIISGDTKIAIVLDKKTNKSQSVKLGASLAGEQSAYKLIELEARKAVFEGPSGRSDAGLRVFDGQGGEAPTAIEPTADPNVAAAQAQPTPDAQATAGLSNPAQPQTPESRAELIRRRIEERRRQMREEAERANQQNGQKQ